MKLPTDNKIIEKVLEPLVSIIVPVYKIERYLDNCVRSLVDQTEKNIEIVLVDDGSPDDCPQICDKWSCIDERIKVLHQANQGVTKARANGVNTASGNWILFVDGDDVIPNNAVECLLEFSKDVDIVVGQVKFIGPYKWPYSSQNKKYVRDEYVLAFLKRKIHGGPVAKLFKKGLFSEFVFDIPSTIKCGEDLIMNLRLAKKAQSVQMIDKSVYHYVFRASSAVTADPFASMKYTVLFNQLIIQSIEITSVRIRVCVIKNILQRCFDCLKSKTKRLLIE